MDQTGTPRTYQYLRDLIAERIDQGVYQANDKLPSERELAEDLNTTRLTLRDALSQLEIEGKVFRMDRRGWFVASERLLFDPVSDKGFMTNVRDQGLEPTTQLLSCEEEKATPGLAQALKIKQGAAIYHLQRRRAINNRPVLIEDIYLDQARYPGLAHAKLDGSLSLVLEEIYSAKVKHSQIQITPVAFNSLHAKSLLVSPGTPATLITRTSFDTDGKVVEFDKEYWVADVLRIEITSADKF